MKFRKIVSIVLPLMTMFLIYSCGGKGGNSHKDPDVVAKIQKEEIKREEINDYYSGLENGFKSQYGDDYEQSDDFKKLYLNLVNQYVDQRVLVQLAKDDGLVNESSIQEKVDEEFENMKSVFGSNEAFETAIVNSRFKDEEDYKNKLKISMIIEELIAKETDNLKISESEVESYYEKNSDKFVKGAGADVYHIFLNDKGLADEALEKINDGESFEDVAKKYGQDGSASVGGYLGYQEFDNSKLVDEFMSEVKAMEEGEIRGPVKTQFGYHIIKVENIKKDEWTQDLERVSSNIEENLKAEKINGVMDSLVSKARDKYKVKVFEDNIISSEE